MNRVLIVGAGGYVGAGLYVELKNSFDTIGASHRRNASDIYFDITKEATWRNVNWHNVDSVLLLAAKSNIAWCAQNKKEANFVNVDSTKRLLDYLVSIGKHVLWFSSSQAFDPLSPSGFARNNFEAPNFYGQSKLIVENYIKDNHPKVAIVRVSKVIGKAFPLFDKWIASVKSCSRIEVFQDHFCSPVSVAWLALRIEHIIRNRGGGVSQFCGAKSISYLTLARVLLERKGLSEHNLRAISARERGVEPDEGKTMPVFSTSEEGLLAQGLYTVIDDYLEGFAESDLCRGLL